MRLFLRICSIVVVAGLSPAFAQNATEFEPTGRAAEAPLPIPGAEFLAGPVGRASVVSGNLELRSAGGGNWAEAELNQPVFTGEALRTDPKARGQIEIGANTIDVSNATEFELASLRDGVTQIVLKRGRIALRLRHAGDDDTVEIDLPQGGIWPLAAGSYDIDAGAGDQPPRVAVFEGAAHFVGSGQDLRIEGGHMAVLAGSGDLAAAIEPAAADAFVEWCRERDYDVARLAAPYYVSANMTGFAELDSAGIWKISPEYGTVWFPTQSEEWAPYRFGHWSWITLWGWTWVDEQPWGFAPSHYGRWARIDDHWAWVPGGFAAHPLYAPPGVGLSSEDGATVAWFPLAPGETYWPSYTRDLSYARSLNLGNVEDVGKIGMEADGEPPLELFNEEFANREYATVVPRTVFINGRPVASARITLPEKRLQDAPVLMASPQIAPASAFPRVAHAVTISPPIARVVNLSRKRSAKAVRTASMQLRARAQPVIIRGAHLHVPSYAGQPHGRQMIVLRVAHSRGSPGKKG
jgi:hypothetical protein